MAQIVSLVYQPGRSKHEPPYHYNRIPAQSLILIAGHGIEGDFKAGRNPKRQINVMAAEMVETLRQEGYKAAPGELGEQIIIAGLDAATLSKGAVLALGDEAVIEVIAPREPCEWFEKIQGKPLQEAEGRIGVLARVITSGRVQVGDTVRLQPLAEYEFSV